MKKIIMAILVIALMVMGCGEKMQHKYVERLDSLTKGAEISYYDAEEILGKYAKRDELGDVYLNYIKEQILEFKELDEFSSLNWDAFDDIGSVYWVDPEEIKDLPEGISLDGWDAVYSRRLEGIIFFPEIDAYSDDQRSHVTTHELCHALLESGSDEQSRNAFIIEGEVELLAITFSDLLGIKPEITYPNGVLTAAWLTELFGEKEMHEAIIDDKLDYIVDEVAGEKMCHRINLGGSLAEYRVNPTIGRNASVEILCYISKTLNKASVGRKWIREFQHAYGDVDTKYFEKILSS